MEGNLPCALTTMDQKPGIAFITREEAVQKARLGTEAVQQQLMKSRSEITIHIREKLVRKMNELLVLLEQGGVIPRGGYPIKIYSTIDVHWEFYELVFRDMWGEIESSISQQGFTAKWARDRSCITIHVNLPVAEMVKPTPVSCCVIM